MWLESKHQNKPVIMRLGLSSGGKCDGLPRLAQLVEHLTVVVKTNVSADIRVSPVQVWERGPVLTIVQVVLISFCQSRGVMRRNCLRRCLHPLQGMLAILPIDPSSLLAVPTRIEDGSIQSVAPFSPTCFCVHRENKICRSLVWKSVQGKQ